jgi:hypothetical protein
LFSLSRRVFGIHGQCEPDQAGDIVKIFAEQLHSMVRCGTTAAQPPCGCHVVKAGASGCDAAQHVATRRNAAQHVPAEETRWRRVRSDGLVRNGRRWRVHATALQAGTYNEEEVVRAKNQTKSAVLMNLEQRIVAVEDIGRQVRRRA